jgi:hypothetical protein
MRNLKSFFLILAVAMLCVSCEKEPHAIAFITNEVNTPIMLYSESDSIFLYPLQRTYLAHIRVENGEIYSCDGFSLFDPITRMGILDTIYDVPEQYGLFLTDLNNYWHAIGAEPGLNSGTIYENSSYDYSLSVEFVKQIISENYIKNN